MNFFRGVCVILSVCTLMSCDAPRVNPLDPESQDYKYFTIEGSVKAQSNLSPMSGVKVTWKNENQNIVVVTNSDGKFKINRLDRINGIIYFEKDGFAKDSSLIQLNGEKSVIKDKVLNALPRLTFYKLYAIVRNFVWGDNTHTDTLNVRARVFDEEGDIDSVAIQNKSINFYKKLDYDSANKLFKASFQTFDLKVSSLIETQGKSFYFVAIDKNKRKYVLDSTYLTRVITQQPKCNSPANDSTFKVDEPIDFKWDRFIPFFKFTFTVQVFNKADDSTPVWEKSFISDLDVGTRLDKKLPAGRYYWVICVIDDFDNKAISPTASFIIQ